MNENISELNLEDMEKVSGGAPGYGGYPEKPPKKAGCKIYHIKQGDTLGKIAREKGTTVELIMAVNPEIKDYNKIRAGWYIYIPV